MRLTPKEQNNQSHDEGHYWISISDLMTSLLFIFVIILAYTIYSFSSKSEIFDENFNHRSQMLISLQKNLKKKDINVDIDPQNGNMRITSDTFFSIGSADLNEQGKKTISLIASEIKQEMSKPKFLQAIDTIFIEGHTDNIPLNNSYGGGRRWTNMELSAQRAINTYIMMDESVKISNMTNQKGQPLFSYSGYADQRPVSNNASAKGRAKNRRIEIFFALNSPQASFKK